LLSERRDPRAEEAYELALGLTEDPAVRRFLNRRRDALRASPT
jgi:predicted RNA polymerase sigma factor